MISICKLTNNLHQQGFYKQLHLHILRSSRISNDQLKHIWAFSSIEKLTLLGLPKNFPVPIVESVKELNSDRILRPFSNIPKKMAMNLVNLERINMQRASSNDIWPFICFAPKLTQLRIYQSAFASDFDYCTFVKLNEEREKLAGARKVVIYVEDDFFIKLKWSAKLNFSLIKLKRIEWCKVEH